MKLLHQNYVKDGGGEVKLVAEEGEDMWHIYNLVREGDQVTATTLRKVMKDVGTSTDSERVKLKLTIVVDTVDFDPQGGVLRLKGKNITNTEHVKLGAYHTIEVEPQRPFTIQKDQWDAVDLDRIRQACDPTASSDLAAVLIGEGVAHICLVGGSTTLIRSKVEASMPKKRGPAAAGFDKQLQKFFNNVMAAVMRHVDFSIVKCLVVAGPGPTKDQFREYLDKEAVRQNIRTLIENKGKVVVANASSPYKDSLKEVLLDPAVAGRIANTKASKEVRALQQFFTMLEADKSRAFYGPGHVFAASELGAIQTLLITDSLFRINDVAKRQKYVGLVESVRDAGGEALVLSSMHVSGEQLKNLSGIAAILRFPLPDVEDTEMNTEL